jgi:hypothetical protein
VVPGSLAQGWCGADLTRGHKHILDAGSYAWRSHASARLPGALVNDFTFTL